MNENHITTEIGRIYFRFWRAGLQALLGWSDEHVFEWVAEWGWRLNNESDSLFNDTPAYIVAPLLIPEELKARLSSEDYLRLVKKIRDALNKPDTFPEEQLDYDWGSAAKRVQSVLGDYGSTLPRV